MNSSLTITDVLNDIEIELLQGSAAQDDLGKGLNMIRQHNNQLRAQHLKAKRGLDLNSLASNQFQTNDMLLTLFQETIVKLQELQVEVRKSLHFADSHGLPSQGAQSENPDVSVVSNGSLKVDLYLTKTIQDFQQVEQRIVPQLAEMKRAMNQDALLLQIDVRPVKIPLIGGLLTRLRSAIHSLSLFYANRLAGKQTDINCLYGEQLLALQQLVQSQQAELVSLRQQVSRLGQQSDINN